MKKRVLTIILGCALVLSGLAGCGGDTSSTTAAATGSGNSTEDGGSADSIEIGVISPNTGSLANYGISVTNAIKMALEEINAEGGVLGKDLVVTEYMDDKADAIEGANCFNKLNESGVSAIIGAVTSGVTASVAELAEEAGMLLLTPTSTADTLTEGKTSIFRACFADSFAGSVMAKFASDLGVEKVAVLYASGDAYSAGLYDSFAEACNTYGLDLVAVESSANVDDTDFTTQLTTIAASGAEFVFAPYYYDVIGPYIVPQAREAGYDGILAGADGWDGVANEEYMTGPVEYYNNCYFANHYAADNGDEKVVSFVSKYTELYGETPNALAALAYDSVYMLAQAIEDAGSAETSDIIAAMDGMSFEGVTGSFTLVDGTPEKSVTVIEIKDGANVFKEEVSVD